MGREEKGLLTDPLNASINCEIFIYRLEVASITLNAELLKNILQESSVIRFSNLENIC